MLIACCFAREPAADTVLDTVWGSAIMDLPDRILRSPAAIISLQERVRQQRGLPRAGSDILSCQIQSMWSRR